MSSVEQYIALSGQVVGNMQDGFDVVYDWNGEMYNTRKEAIRVGLADRGSDDFNIGVVRDGKLIDFAWMDEGGMASDDELAEIADQIGLSQEDDHAV